MSMIAHIPTVVLARELRRLDRSARITRRREFLATVMEKELRSRAIAAKKLVGA